jgi:hypothetical protein
MVSHLQIVSSRQAALYLSLHTHTRARSTLTQKPTARAGTPKVAAELSKARSATCTQHQKRLD